MYFHIYHVTFFMHVNDVCAYQCIYEWGDMLPSIIAVMHFLCVLRVHQ